MMPETSPNLLSLIENPIPRIDHDQIEKFTRESIHADAVTSLDLEQAANALAKKEGSLVIGADFGGDKGVTQLFVIKNGQLIPDERYSDFVQGDYGEKFLESLEKTAKFAKENNIPVGISWGAPLDGTKPQYHPKMKAFHAVLQEKYQGDFAVLLPTLAACYNDGPAGLISGALEAKRQYSSDTILFPINGGGLGLAALVNGEVISTESGHIEAVPSLNTYNRTGECGVFGSKYVCLEMLGANKAGIEAQWEALTGSRISAKVIEDKYREGDTLAADLYDHSAWVVSHMVLGAAKALGIDTGNNSTAIVAHGSAFKFPGYGSRIQQIITNETGSKLGFIMTKDYIAPSSNACLDGAAYAAVIHS